mgnify:CR=1 FL=1
MHILSNSNFLWNHEDLLPVLPIILTLISFILYWFTANSSKVKKYYYSKYSFDVAAYKHIFFTKLLAFMILTELYFSLLYRYLFMFITLIVLYILYNTILFYFILFLFYFIFIYFYLFLFIFMLKLE